MAKTSHSNGKKSIDSGLCAEGGSSEYQGPTGMSHDLQQATVLPSSSVLTFSGGNNVEDGSGRCAPSSGVEEADSVVEGPPEASVKTMHGPLHKDGMVSKKSTLQSSTELAEKLARQCTLMSFSSDGDPVSPSDGTPPGYSPMLSAQDQAATLSLDSNSSASVGGATAACTPEKEKRFVYHKSDIVGIEQDSSVQSHTRMYFDRIVLEKEGDIAELQSTVSELKELYKEAVLAKEKVEHRLLIVEQQHSMDKTEMLRLEYELERFSECVADMEKSHLEEKEKYESEIEELEKMRGNRGTTHALEREVIELEILEHLKAMEVGDEKLRHLQTELDLAFLKRENAVLKAERDAAVTERDSVKAELERLKSCQN